MALLAEVNEHADWTDIEDRIGDKSPDFRKREGRSPRLKGRYDGFHAPMRVSPLEKAFRLAIDPNFEQYPGKFDLRLVEMDLLMRLDRPS
jgi:hypothetical protein